MTTKKLTIYKAELVKVEQAIDILESSRTLWGPAQERERYQLWLEIRKLRVAIARTEFNQAIPVKSTKEAML